MPAASTVGTDIDPVKALRKKWAESLADHMRVHGNMTRKQLQRSLEERGCEVSLQAIGYWLNGDTSPRPLVQAELAAIFRVPPHSLFPIEAAA